MARHRQDTSSKPSSGLLSNVFSFVSREFESFVLNATASQPVSTERVKASGRRRRDAESYMSEDEARYRSRTQHRPERERRSKRELSRRKPRSKSTDTTKKYRQEHTQPTYVADNDRAPPGSDQEHPGSPTPRPSFSFPVPPTPKLKKQPSFTMPGALFPRSPSLMPDQPDTYHYTHSSVRPSLPPYATDPHEPGPSWTHPSTGPSADAVDPGQPSLDEYVSPWRTRSVASVKDAVQRFSATDGAEADFSLMLPSPHSSPVRPVFKVLSIEEMSPSHSTSGTLPTVCRKGAERARDVTNDDDLDFIVGGGSGCGGVHAKERELDAAREEQREHERVLSGDQSSWASDERERDKRRIKALEEEVRRLKEELSRSQMQASSFTVPPAPPPPPPPPPPPLPLRIDTVPCTPTTMFVNARASLRHAMTPVEAPINPVLSKSRRQGQPTVNVPSEKMAAFLQEIMTAKLRKVGSGLNAMGGDGVAGPSGLSKSLSVTSSSVSTGPGKLSAQELQRRRSLASLRVPIGSSRAAPVPASVLATMRESEARVGQKRKADALGVDEPTGVPPKRLMTDPSSQSSSESSQHTTTTSGLSLRSNLSLPPLPLSTNETDVTTPSLCSDNDRDENSIEDRVPSTPPGPRSTGAARKPPTTDDVPGEQIEVMDIEMEKQSPEARTTSPCSVPRRTSDLFKKRPPGSPIPIPTPRRPSAPARTKRGATPKPKNLPSLESDLDEDDGIPSQPAPVPFISLIPVPKTKTSKPSAKPTSTSKGRPRTSLPQQNGRTSWGSGSNSQSKRKKGHKRRQTLDEELRMAEAHSSDMDERNDELEEEEPEEDVFIAKGTKNKRRGFLAHGGGGGAPVFMGVGYVEGATLDSEAENGGTQPRRTSKPTNQTSLIPRPKARP